MESSFQRTLADDSAATIAVVGEVDFSNADELADCVRGAVADWSPATIRVDLRAASFIDSSGLGALIEGYRAATEIEAAFLVVNPSASFRRVLDVTGLYEFFGLGVNGEKADQTQATGA
jgi:anti-sigma B factor antagonist